ncbi:type II secretion system F family protein [bacterium]|nr:type II secretion system F family protein [bacterium]
MPNFFYKAKDRDGREISGNLVAKNERELIEKLDSQGYFPLLIQSEVSGERTSFNQRIKLADLAFFFRQLSDLLSSEMPLDRASSFLAEEVESKNLKRIIGQISLKVGQGKSLSEALKDHPTIFNLKFISLVRAGELGGFLSESFFLTIFSSLCPLLRR